VTKTKSTCQVAASHTLQAVAFNRLFGDLKDFQFAFFPQREHV